MDERLARGIGKAVRARRKARGLSQEQLAESIDIAPQFLGRIERGLTLPSVPTLCSLAGGLDIMPGQLLPDPAHGIVHAADAHAVGYQPDAERLRQLIAVRIATFQPSTLEAVWRLCELIHEDPRN